MNQPWGREDPGSPFSLCVAALVNWGCSWRQQDGDEAGTVADQNAAGALGFRGEAFGDAQAIGVVGMHGEDPGQGLAAGVGGGVSTAIAD